MNMQINTQKNTQNNKTTAVLYHLPIKFICSFLYVGLYIYHIYITSLNKYKIS